MWKNETTFCALQNNSIEINHSYLAAHHRGYGLAMCPALCVRLMMKPKPP